MERKINRIGSLCKHILKLVGRVKIQCFLMLFLLLNFQGCIESFKFEIPKSTKKLVVDGFITTEMKAHEVLLSYSTPYYDAENFDPVTKATVSILSNQGAVINLTETDPGKYVTEPLAAEVGISYKLTIEVNGNSYESGFEQVIGVTPFDTIHYEYKKDEFSGNGIFVYAINTETQGEPTYLFWDYTGHQMVFRLYSDPLDLDLGEIIYSCISTERCENCLNITSDKLISSSTYNQFIAKIPYTTTSKYMMKIDKYAISPNVFEYYTRINNIVNNTGTIFDSPPSLIRGNILNVHDEDEIVHGYFYAADYYSKIFTINRGIFSDPPEQLPPLNPRPCEKDPRNCNLTLPDPTPCPNVPPPFWE